MIHRILKPGDTIGIIGNSIGNDFLIMNAKQTGFKVGYYSSSKTINNYLADFTIIGNLNNKDKLKRFAQKCDLITYNSTNIQSSTIKYIENFTDVPQNSIMLDMIQDRLIKQSFFDQINVNTVPYVTIVNLKDLYQGIDSIGYPAILRPIQSDFNGNKKLLIKNQMDIAKADVLLNHGAYVLESYIPHNKTFSIITANSFNQASKTFPIVQNNIINNKVVTAFSPTNVDPLITDELKRIAKKITNNIRYYGIIEISFILGSNDNIYVHDINPFLSTSSFLFDHANVNEFQMYLKSVLGLPLPLPKLFKPTLLKTFDQKQWGYIKKKWPFPSSWNCVFYNQFNDSISNVKGHFLIEGNSIEQIIKSIDKINM